MYPLRTKLCDLSWSLVRYHRFSTSSPLLAQRGNHYTNLELDKNATQTEIKTAYYRLSKLYHPDKNEGSDEAATKFREITAAYEVLGNVNSRKLYDRGMSNTQSIYEAPSYDTAADSEDDTTTKFERARHNKKPSKFYTGRTDAYNFDEWTRAHYSQTFTRHMQSRDKVSEIRYMNQMNRDLHEENVFRRYLFFFVALAFLLYVYKDRDGYDDVLLIEQRKALKRKEEANRAENPH